MKKICPDLQYLEFLASFAGKIMANNFFAKNQIEWKKDGSPVMGVDMQICQFVLSSLAKDFPHVSVITEEGSRKLPDAEYVILCDPLDGTIPYMAGVPCAAFSVVLLKDLDPIRALIYEPFLGRLWTGEKGKPSTENKKKISVSGRRNLKRSSLCILYWPGAYAGFSEISGKAQEAGAFCISAAAVSLFGGLLASGKFDGIMFPGESYWEAIAIDLIVKGAGGLTTDAKGEEIIFKEDKKMAGMISSNGHLHDELFSLFL